MARVYVTRKIPGQELDRLINSEHDVEVSPFDRVITPQEMLEKAKNVDAILTLLSERMTGEVMDELGENLKIISNYAVGYNNIDIEEATKRGILVTNTPSDEVNESVAEHAWALLLALTRRVVEADEVTRVGMYKGWEPAIFLGTNVVGKTLGIVGMGRIGEMMARRASGFNMRVLYHNRSRKEDAEKSLGVEYRENLKDLLAESDFISLHVPLTDETRGMINSDTLSATKRGAYIINTARGPIVHEQDLVEFLRNGHIAGAGLDVFENEPAINPELSGMENAIMTPHIASATWEARNKMGQQAVDAILKTLAGEKPDNLVNEDAWDNRRK